MNHDDTRKPTAKQQRYLGSLAEQTGSTFVRPPQPATPAPRSSA